MPAPEAPFYVPSKSRADIATTPRLLARLGIPCFVIVEEQQYGMYRERFPAEQLLVLDRAYQEKYATCDGLGESKSLGPGPARNFAWDHARSEGAGWHWVIDDNIRGFFRLHANERIPLGDGTGFRAMEDFCSRYTNVAMAGPNYYMFAPSRAPKQPFTLNTRVYSCNLIRNDLPFSWRGRYNEDTILSIDMLKAGWVTVLFHAFLQWKAWTQTWPGGNTEAFYGLEGTLPKSRMLVQQHPDVTRLVWRFKRWHHYVDYSRFAGNRLRRRPDYVPAEQNPYALRKIAVGNGHGIWPGTPVSEGS